MALLVSRGYAAYVERFAQGVLPSRTLIPYAGSKFVTIRDVAEALWRQGVSVEETTQWDPLVIAWCRDYVGLDNVKANDDIVVGLKERESPTRVLTILQCLGTKTRIPRLQYTEKTPLQHKWLKSMIKGKSAEGFYTVDGRRYGTPSDDDGFEWDD
jgi:hypothetical protein